MEVTRPWGAVTRSQLGQVNAPNARDGQRLKQLKGEDCAQIDKAADRAAYEAHDTASVMTIVSVFSGVATAFVTGIAAANSATGLATALGGLGGAVALGTGYLAYRAHNEDRGLNHFRGDLKTWAEKAEASLEKPGVEAGTIASHRYYESGVFSSLCDVRKDDRVVARHALLNGCLNLHEDVAQQTVTVEGPAGTRVIPRASLELPTTCGDLKIHTWADSTRVVQTVSVDGSSEASFGDQSVNVGPLARRGDYGHQGLELPDGTLRFDGGYGQDIFLARPPLANRELNPDAKPYTQSTVAVELDRGHENYLAAPPEGVEPLHARFVPRQQLLVSRDIPVGSEGLQLVEDVPSGQVSLRGKDGKVFETRTGHLDAEKGTLTEEQPCGAVTQNVKAYPAADLRVGSTRITVDPNDNVRAYKDKVEVPAHLSGRTVEAGEVKVEIPLQHRSYN